jgi:hypothetical protein
MSQFFHLWHGLEHLENIRFMAMCKPIERHVAEVRRYVSMVLVQLSIADTTLNCTDILYLTTIIVGNVCNAVLLSCHGADGAGQNSFWREARIL